MANTTKKAPAKTAKTKTPAKTESTQAVRLARIRERLQSIAILAVQAQNEIDRDDVVRVNETIGLLEEDMAKASAELEIIVRTDPKFGGEWLPLNRGDY